jgi:hypothetical protein
MNATGKTRDDARSKNAVEHLLDFRIGSHGRLDVVDDFDDALDAPAQLPHLPAPGGVLHRTCERDDPLLDGELQRGRRVFRNLEEHARDAGGKRLVTGRSEFRPKLGTIDTDDPLILAASSTTSSALVEVADDTVRDRDAVFDVDLQVEVGGLGCPADGGLDVAAQVHIVERSPQSDDRGEGEDSGD